MNTNDFRAESQTSFGVIEALLFPSPKRSKGTTARLQSECARGKGR